MRAMTAEQRARHKQKNREWYLRNADELNARSKQRYESLTPEQRRQRNQASKAWYHKNLLKARAIQLATYHRNSPKSTGRPLTPEKLAAKRASSAAYYKTPKGKESIRNCSHTRRAKMQAVPATVSIEDLSRLRASQKRCYYCGVRGKLTIDHVQPISKGGAHSRDNIVMACRPCNCSKNARDPNEFARTRGLLFAI